MVVMAVPVSFGHFPMNESGILTSRIRCALLPCADAYAGILLKRPPFASSFKGVCSKHIPALSNKLHVFYHHQKKYKYTSPRAINVTTGQPDGPHKLDVDSFTNVLRKLWDCFPQPVRTFPWTKVAEEFRHLIFSLIWEVAKYLSLPLLAVSSLSEMSYCAHERKMTVIPIPLLAGFALVGAWDDATRDLVPEPKELGVPVHLLLITAFLLLLKLPGPYYPYWGRLVIPHFANGGLWRAAWSAFMWYRELRRESGEALGVSVRDISSEGET